jgi:hypothetical protein
MICRSLGRINELKSFSAEMYQGAKINRSIP